MAQIHVVGVGAKKPKKFKKRKGLSKEDRKADMERYKLLPKDLSNGEGVEFMFDKAKKLWILCERQEDRLLLLLQNDPEKGMVISGRFLWAYHIFFACYNYVCIVLYCSTMQNIVILYSYSCRWNITISCNI
jgi:hypothetical protein